MGLFQSSARQSERSPEKLHRARVGASPFAVVGNGDLVAVFWGTVPLYQFRKDDVVGRYVAAVELVQFHRLRAEFVAPALGLGVRTVYRLLKRYEKGGVSALLGSTGRRMPTKLRGAKARQLVELRKRGVSYREAAQRLGVSSTGAFAATRRLSPEAPIADPTPSRIADPTPSRGEAERPRVDAPMCESGDPCPVGPTEPVVEVSSELESSLPAAIPSVPAGGSESPAAKNIIGSSITVDADPLDRQGDRLMAKLGLLDDAPPLFAPGIVPSGGVLLAVPLVASSGIFDAARQVYTSIGPAFYGLRTSTLAFVLMALQRVKRAENLKEVPPQDLGRVLGLDRAPEMKTLRGKMKELASREKSLEFMRLLARRRTQVHSDVQAYLYIDGHVRVYSGKEKLSKAYVMQRRLAMPGTTDYLWYSHNPCRRIPQRLRG